MEVLKCLFRPREFMAVLSCNKENKELKKNLECLPTNMKCYYELLSQTSRSFSVTTMKLDPEIRDVVCIFYLILRALDTIEDDTSIERNKRVAMLEKFSEYLDDPEWKFQESNDKYKIVLEEFPKISQKFRKLEDHYQQIIRRTCTKMGHGMVKYLDTNPQTISQWDEYCYFVAGLLGEELTKIFVISNLEEPEIADDFTCSISMGIFLQKVNIIRDYLEDIEIGRQFWPTSVWKKYADKLEDFSKPENMKLGVFCLNELITNALQHVPDVLTYLSRLRNKSTFHFCAIPQLMAIATLERCYDNRNIFTGIVKIRRSEASYLITRAKDFTNIKKIFYHYTIKIRNRIPASDPSAIETMEKVEQILKICHVQENCPLLEETIAHYLFATIVAIMIFLFYSYVLI